MKKINNLKAEYLKICPIDKNRAEIKEILKFGECLNDYKNFGLNYSKLLIKIKDCEQLKESCFFCKTEKKLLLFKKYFKKILGYQPLNLQLYWTKKALKNESFSIIAPTGFGKSTFGIIFSLFCIEILNEKKIYYLVPTKILINEIEKKFNLYNKNKKVKILAIKNKLDKDKLNNEYDILITTTQFLHKNFDILPKNFNLIYIDDADSMIRQPKNIDKVLELIGFKKEDIELTLKIIDSKRKRDYNLSNLLKNNLDLTNKGKIIVASATLTPKTKRINLFRELLNFEIGNSNTYLRNISDFYEEINDKNKLFETSVKWINYLKRGGFIFLSDDFSKENFYQYLNYLQQNNIKYISYEKFHSKNIQLFEKGEFDVVVGFSNIRNPLTRGIDLPHIIRYTLFVGVPKFKIPLKITYSPRILLMMVLTFQEYLKDYEDILTDIKFLKKYSFMKEESILENKNLKTKVENIQTKIKKLFNDEAFFDKIKQSENLNIAKINDTNFLLISDPKGYIQASGRASRLYPLGLTKGISIVLVDDKKVFNNLNNRLRLLGYKINFLNIKDHKEELQENISLVDKDRNLIKKITSGNERIIEDPVKTALIIVESPTKAKTIANFFGKPARKIYNNFWVYEVSLGNYLLNIIATLGHFVDLVNKESYYGVKKDEEFLPIFEPLKICLKCTRHIDIDENKCPICQSSDFLNKELLIETLRNLANNVQEIYLTTDPDTEGEKIAFDLFVYLYPYNKNIKRIELHEITKEEFLKRFKEPRNLNIDLVCAQITRRIADRWIGFSLSEKIQNEFKNLNLSAGRVQTPVLGWIINREIERKKNKIYYIRLFFKNNYYDIQTENNELIKNIRKFKNDLFIEIKFLKSKTESINPLPPFQTSELLKYSWSLLKFDLQTTMSLAQDLFERGLITYHRTDSTYVSELGRDIAYEFIKKRNKLDLIYKRSWGKPGSHECIRPTKPLSVEEVIEQLVINQNEFLSKKHLKLYNLILGRFIASQCKPAKIKKTLLYFKLITKDKIILESQKEIISEITYNGFNEFFYHIYPFKIQPGRFNVTSLKINRFSKELLYTNASIIDEMKRKKLGRPSTYSSIIQTLLERKYIIIKKGYLIPTNQGKNIYNYLVSKYNDLINEGFTQELEDNMDKIEKKKLDYQKVLNFLFKRLFQ